MAKKKARKRTKAEKTALVISALRADERVLSIQANLMEGRIVAEIEEVVGYPAQTIVLTVRSR